MNRIKQTAISVKNHILDHKAAYVMGAVAAGAIALHQSNRIEFYKFLEEKGIDPMEYYCPEYFHEQSV
jgi:hypothetical protein